MAGNGTASEDTFNEHSTNLVVPSLSYNNNISSYPFNVADTDAVTNTENVSNGKT